MKNSYARMASVVTDLLERLDAELSNDDVVCTLQVFDLQEWSNADMTEARRQRMFSYLRVLAGVTAVKETQRVAGVTAAKENKTELLA